MSVMMTPDIGPGRPDTPDEPANGEFLGEVWDNRDKPVSPEAVEAAVETVERRGPVIAADVEELPE